MSDASNVARSLRERFGGTTEERLGKALSELLENPLLTGAIGRAFDARERASQAQEVAMGALNIPSAADIERLTRRLRSVSHRLEGIEDGVDRLDRSLTPSGVEARLSAIEQQLSELMVRLDRGPAAPANAAAARPASARAKAPSAVKASRPSAKAARASAAKAAKTSAVEAAKTSSARTKAPARKGAAAARPRPAAKAKKR